MADNPVQLTLEKTVPPEYAPTPPPNRRILSPHETESSKADANRQVQETGFGDPSQDSVKLVRDETTGRSFVQILDRKTGEVIYEIPPEQLRKIPELSDKVSGKVIDTVA